MLNTLSTTTISKLKLKLGNYKKKLKKVYKKKEEAVENRKVM
jgi:hypothetical protein